jgi:hypothetical protein
MRLSVVVTIVDGGEALTRCLEALAAQADPPPLEVIVPWDPTVDGIPVFADRFPAFRFLSTGALAPTTDIRDETAQHERFDRRRSSGLASATGDVVAILEDRGVPALDWAREVIAAHQRLPHAAIGGAIENGVDETLAWAVFFCDFNRYQRPFLAGPREWISDVNVSYKRRALEATRQTWRDRYHETTVHWALRRMGETLYLTPAFGVAQMRPGLTLRGLIRERCVWGRLFAYTRAREVGPSRRLGYLLGSPLLPVLLFVRHAGLQVRKRATLGRFVVAAPAIAVLLAAWSLGEAVGYLTDRP